MARLVAVQFMECTTWVRKTYIYIAFDLDRNRSHCRIFSLILGGFLFHMPALQLHTCLLVPCLFSLVCSLCFQVDLTRTGNGLFFGSEVTPLPSWIRGEVLAILGVSISVLEESGTFTRCGFGYIRFTRKRNLMRECRPTVSSCLCVCVCVVIRKGVCQGVCVGFSSDCPYVIFCPIL